MPGVAFDWLGSPRLATAQIVPLLIGALGVTATVFAILAGVGELFEIFPRQHLSFGISLYRLENIGRVLSLFGVNDGAFVSTFSFGFVWRDRQGSVSVGSDQAGGGHSLVPGQQFRADDLIHVSGHEAALGGTITIRWAADRSKRTEVITLSVPTREEMPVVPT